LKSPLPPIMLDCTFEHRDLRDTMPPKWEDLELYQVDLHIHAGTERPPALTLLDFVDFSVATGRRIIGITDHFGRYLGLSRKKLNHYPGTIKGYQSFIQDVRGARSKYTDEIILFGPEFGLGNLVSREGELALGTPGVDFFIGEPGSPPDGKTLGDYLVEGVREIRSASDEYGVPGFLGHPLRGPINRIAGKAGQGPKMPGHPPFPPLSKFDDPKEHVEELLQVDLSALARESVRRDVPIELNDSSWGRMLGMNHQSLLERYLFFFRGLIEGGARVILGSDMHNVEHPAPTPFIAAEFLEVVPGDLTFLRHWLGSTEALGG